MWQYITTDELYHYGIPGMKWGVSRGEKGYRSTSIRSAIARRKNAKVDASFKKWKDSNDKRDTAINLGKKANVAKIAYEKNPSNKTLKTDYKQANKEYKQALRKNTTYRKGVVRQAVGQDISRKYLSEAKKIKKQLTSDPNNKDLNKTYSKFMSKHDVERSKARRAVDVGSRRSAKKAAIKRTMTMTAASVAGTAAVAGGLYAVNSYLNNHNVTLNGNRVRVSGRDVQNITKVINLGKSMMGFMY